MRSLLRRELLNAALIVAGILSAAMGIKGFLLSSGFIDGGVTGVSMLLARVSGLPLAVLLPAINLPFVALGFHQMGAVFAARSILGIAGLAGALAFVPLPDVTPDLVLTAVFGGFFLGAGIGLAIRGGAVLDGTEIAALLISRRGDVLRVGDIILGFNAVLFVSAIALLGVEPALYSILTYLAAARTLDFVIHGIDEYTAVTIVSDRHGEIRQRIMHALGRGVTIYRGAGGMSGQERDILYCVVTRLEIGKVKAIVREIDPDAFVVYHALAGAEGGVVKTRGFH
ncbi:MAG TPA: YitT family protein [Vicinamibacterales bacterium]